MHLEKIEAEKAELARMHGLATDLEPLKSGEATAKRPNRKQRRSMTRRQKQATGAAFELRHAKEILKRAGAGPRMDVVRSRNGN